MVGRQTAPIPITLERVRQRFEQWRRTRTPRRSPIPAALWSAAVAVARQHGAYATARALHLDYTALKTRMPAAADRTAAPAAPTFVELPPVLGTGTCLIEIESPCGGTMRVHVNGATLPDLVALTRVVWSGAA
jgi:hypothetical protein